MRRACVHTDGPAEVLTMISKTGYLALAPVYSGETTTGVDIFITLIE